MLALRLGGDALDEPRCLDAPSWCEVGRPAAATGAATTGATAGATTGAGAGATAGATAGGSAAAARP
jgi:hypothetical protein